MMGAMGPFAPGWTEDDVEAVIQRDDPVEVLHAPIVVGMHANGLQRTWAESVCQRLARHPDPRIRVNALMGFGHIARTCKALDTAAAAPFIVAGMEDPDEAVRDAAHTAASDVSIYAGDDVPGFTPVCWIVVEFRGEAVPDVDKLVAVESTLRQLVDPVAELDGLYVDDGRPGIMLFSRDPVATLEHVKPVLDAADLLEKVCVAYRRPGAAGYIEMWPEAGSSGCQGR